MVAGVASALELASDIVAVVGGKTNEEASLGSVMEWRGVEVFVPGRLEGTDGPTAMMLFDRLGAGVEVTDTLDTSNNSSIKSSALASVNSLTGSGCAGLVVDEGVAVVDAVAGGDD